MTEYTIFIRNYSAMALSVCKLRSPSLSFCLSLSISLSLSLSLRSASCHKGPAFFSVLGYKKSFNGQSL